MDAFISPEKLKILLKKKSMRQKDLEPILDLSPQKISQIMNSQRKISEAEQKLLQMFFYGKVPFSLPAKKPQTDSLLSFTQEEWKLLEKMSLRSGFPNAKEWIVSQIRAYLAFCDNQSTTQASTPTQATENPPLFKLPLIEAAAGKPIESTLQDSYYSAKAYGKGRFAVRLCGSSMEPRYQDGEVVILREKKSLKTPFLKKGEIYLFDWLGEKNIKRYNTRKATEKEIQDGASYTSIVDGVKKVHILESINPNFQDIVISPENAPQWLGWLDKKDNLY